MQSFRSFILLIESVKDAKRIWSQKYDSDRVDRYIDKFRELSTKNQISGSENDIGYWIKQGFDEFTLRIDMLSDLQIQKNLVKSKSKDVSKVFENDEVSVYEIKSFEASCKYGAGTKWCITGSDSSHWDDYYEQQHVTFYFIISKTLTSDDILYKIAVAVYPRTDFEFEIYAADDSNVEIEELETICAESGIPMDIFQIREIITFKDSVKNITHKERIEKINARWMRYYGGELIWNSTYSSAIAFEYKNLLEFANKHGNYTAKYCAEIFAGDKTIDFDGVSSEYIQYCLEMLSQSKLNKYLEEDYPDEREEYEADLLSFLEDKQDDLYYACTSAAMCGVQQGTEDKMLVACEKALENITLSTPNGDVSVTEVDIWGEPFQIKVGHDTLVNILDDANLSMFNDGLSFEFEVEEPYYGFDDFDHEAAKEYLRDSDFSHLL